MFCESVNNMASRSIPIPQPPVGGKPYSRAVQKVSSTAIASSSPDCRSCIQITNIIHKKIFKKNSEGTCSNVFWYKKWSAIPWVAQQIAAVVQQGRSVQCMHCRAGIYRTIKAGEWINYKEKKKTKKNKSLEVSKHTSCLLINNSKRSVRPGLSLCHFAKGLIISGWLMMKVGFTHVPSKKWPTSCNHGKMISQLLQHKSYIQVNMLQIMISQEIWATLNKKHPNLLQVIPWNNMIEMAFHMCVRKCEK